MASLAGPQYECTRTSSRFWSCRGRYVDSEEVQDCHCHVFTPQSFFSTFAMIATLELVEYTVRGFHNTEVNTNQFFVALKRLDEPDPLVRRRTVVESIPEV